MTTPRIIPASVQPLPYRLDHDAWVRYLQGRVVADGTWRPGEFDLERWLSVLCCDR